jgi:hypothetical protein
VAGFAEVAVTHPVIAGVEDDEMQGHAARAGYAAFAVRQAREQGVDALARQQRRGAAGRDEPRAERQRRHRGKR